MRVSRADRGKRGSQRRGKSSQRRMHKDWSEVVRRWYAGLMYWSAMEKYRSEEVRRLKSRIACVEEGILRNARALGLWSADEALLREKMRKRIRIDADEILSMLNRQSGMDQEAALASPAVMSSQTALALPAAMSSQTALASPAALSGQAAVAASSADDASGEDAGLVLVTHMQGRVFVVTDPWEDVCHDNREDGPFIICPTTGRMRVGPLAASHS